MPFYPRSAIPLAFTLLLCSTSVSRGDPVTAAYDIHVLQFSTWINGAGQSVSMDQRFTLWLTIDPDLAEQFSPYGPALFSPLPLTPIEPPADLPLTPFARTAEHVFHDQPLVVYRSAIAQIFGEGSVISPETHYATTVELFGAELLSQPSPVLTAERFLRNLGVISPAAREGLGPRHAFQYYSYVCVGGGSAENCFSGQGEPNTFMYTGTAVFRRIEAPAPVPEPASLLLLTGGLGALGLRIRRKCRHNLEP